MMKNELLHKLWCICILCFASFTSLAQITFGPESGMTQPPTSGGFIDNNYYWNEYGVKFEVIDQNGNINPARLARVGGKPPGGATAFGNNTNPNQNFSFYTDCDSELNYGYDYSYGTNIDFGCWFLTDDNVSANYPQTHRIDYNNAFQNTTTASGYIFDVDGAEGWQIHAYTNNNLITPEVSRQIIGPFWHNSAANASNTCTQCNYVASLVMAPTTTVIVGGVTKRISAHNNNVGHFGDAEARYWEINTQYPINRIVIEYLGNPDPSVTNVGVGFDGFGGVSRCNITAKFQWAVDASNAAKVNFTDQSSIHNDEKIVSRIWTVDGASISGNPSSYIFAQSGTYEVCLEVNGVDANGVCCSDKYCETISINIPNTPCAMDPDFDFLCFSGNDCFLQFIGESRNSTRNVRSWFWEFGDGTSSNLPNPIHYYANSGSYQVCLTIVGEDAASCCVETYCETVQFSCNGVGLTSSCDNASSVRSSVPKTSVGFDQAPTTILNEAIQVNEEVTDSDLYALKLVPNPAESITMLHYSLPEDSNLSIELLDAMGSQRKVILAEKKMLKGDHIQEIKLYGLKRGHYLVKLNANGIIKNVQLIVKP